MHSPDSTVPSPFACKVYAIVQEIPAGVVSSYGQIAAMIPPADGAPPSRLAARWVGTALRRSPLALEIPWHRVINSRGQISFPGGSAQAQRQKQLLEAEGIAFDERGRVDMSAYRWRGPSEDFLQREGLLAP